MSDVRRAPDATLGQNLLEASRARERAKEHDRSRELWLTTLTQTLVERAPKLTLPAELVAAAGTVEGTTARASAPSAASGSPSTGGGDASGTGALDDAPWTSRAHGPPSPDGGPHDAPAVPAELSAEVSDEHFGRLQLHIARAEGGLDIVINVADSHVKALIEAEQAMLVKTLKDAGLHVASVQIGSTPRAGTPLALDRAGPERTRARASFPKASSKRRSYAASLEEDDDPDSDGVDFTA
jgi:flagellar hook-length control protein FliK